jgi:hypothetical protein
MMAARTYTTILNHCGVAKHKFVLVNPGIKPNQEKSPHRDQRHQGSERKTNGAHEQLLGVKNWEEGKTKDHLQF